MNKLIFICCLFLTGHVFSQSVATVLFTSHTVKVKRGGVESNISRGASLQNGDTIVTSGQAVAKIKYANGTLVTLGENSVYKILAYSGNQHDIQIKSELTSGKIHSKTSGKKKEILKTPVVALAILGTDYNVYTPNSKATYVLVNEGTIQANGKTLDIGAGFLITAAGISEAPFPLEGRVDDTSGAGVDLNTEVNVNDLDNLDVAATSLDVSQAANVAIESGTSIQAEEMVPAMDTLVEIELSCGV
ncbi:FecR family protein [Legionella spiritensis]|uniref:FecR family protein n=1 Tax=Legionella spiritensis TaxID=452 RepID=UPI000F703E8A|nr:FecR family protein [Legionella spiritensis]VEG89610.1 FecR protein [Legionella spiritensis]